TTLRSISFDPYKGSGHGGGVRRAARTPRQRQRRRTDCLGEGGAHPPSEQPLQADEKSVQGCESRGRGGLRDRSDDARLERGVALDLARFRSERRFGQEMWV